MSSETITKPSLKRDIVRLIPAEDEQPLLRGLLIGVAIGATIVTVVLVARTIKQRRAAANRTPPASSA
ncbi:hypothetical protein [Candidatus Chloroploca sp. Khr17]|uniref:hypothetical protein n=1 Tax=Candidatus Chloroploca sp. Khr17 TaxID=2496869 RepID=UPI00101C68B5|nr:hypothetical protein [Candidatus Chloroploca sp. Khr17]